MTEEQLIFVALDYLKQNPCRFNSQEKAKFMQSLREWLDGKMVEIDDELYDFLIDVGVLKAQRREEEFISYLNKKYGKLKFGKILDVGAGRMCKLSEALTRYGNIMYAIDPNIRLEREETFFKNLAIKKDKFYCDEYAKHGKGTLIDRYDHIVGLEPCDATEHIIRQGLKYDKPFDIMLCAAPHKALNGRKFESYVDWYLYLSSISSEIDISKVGESYYASNVKYHDIELDR